MSVGMAIVLIATSCVILLLWLAGIPSRRRGRERHKEQAEQRRRERERTGEKVPVVKRSRLRSPGWYSDPWARPNKTRDLHQRLWDGWEYGWTQHTRVLPHWSEHLELSEGWLVWWDGEKYDFDRCRPPTIDECRHPVAYRLRRSDRRFSCDLCGLLGPCPHIHKRTWTGPTVGPSWECYDCGKIHNAQLIPPPGSPGNR